jgi:hypothetical protein
MKLVDDAFASDGPIARALPGFEPREGQLRMARLIERGFSRTCTPSSKRGPASASRWPTWCRRCALARAS